MGLFDFFKKKNARKEEKVECAKKDHGVCVPVHRLSAEEKKKLAKKKEVSPFDKLRMQHLKEQAEFSKEFKEISEQIPQEPFDYEPDLGVESIETKPSPAKIEYDSEDELDVAAQKMSEGYVPKFSSTARQKLGLEEKAKPVVSVSGSLEVSGVYIGAETMISGTVSSGRLRKSMTAAMGKGTIRISDLKKGSMTVGELKEGEEGTIFVRGNATSVKYGDIVDFS
jgi:hypothetical protein